jgi:hypothetical protein
MRKANKHRETHNQKIFFIYKNIPAIFLKKETITKLK